MKRHWLAGFGLFVAAGLFLVSVKSVDAQRVHRQPAATAADRAAEQRDLLSYGVGYHLGEEVRVGLELDGIEANQMLIARGFADGLYDRETMMPPEEFDEVLVLVHQEMKRRMVERMLKQDPAFRELHDKNLARSKAFHAKHKAEQGVVTLEDGLQYKVIRSGDGPSPGPDDVVLVTFSGKLLDGREFNAGVEMEIDLDDVTVTGRRVAQMMKVGDQWHVAVPPELGYGAAGEPEFSIGPNETLLFDIELLGIR
jgi:FKBP-type peptidyl-prolyl cis-trans isomerase